jgi:hypothetical protein
MREKVMGGTFGLFHYLRFRMHKLFLSGIENKFYGRAKKVVCVTIC